MRMTRVPVGGLMKVMNADRQWLAQGEARFQHDADLLRLEHLLYWSGLIEAYHAKLKRYPLQRELANATKPGLVKIISRQQQQFLSPGSGWYNRQLDQNAHGNFEERPVKELIIALERGLGRHLAEKYDIQQIPTAHPVGYSYRVSAEGYALSAPCLNAAQSELSSLLDNGITPVITIVSPGMQAQVERGWLRDELAAHPQFRHWQSIAFIKETHVRSVEASAYKDSKH